MELILVRHPKPQVAPAICYGSSDINVAAFELDAACQRLRAELPPGLPVYSSPLQRCAELASRIDGASLCFDPRLVEMHFGAWEMRTWDDIPRVEIDAWAADVARYRPGDGETVLEMAARVDAFYGDLARAAAPAAVVVCHAGTIRLLMARAQGMTIEAMAKHAGATANRVAYGEAIILQTP